jgi:hypothetical protein
MPRYSGICSALFGSEGKSTMIEEGAGTNMTPNQQKQFAKL